MEPYKIVLVRHGESEWNQENLFCGWYDADLTEKGRRQAAKAGKTLNEAGYAFDIAYTSTLTRAQSTLHSILTEMGQPDIPVTKTWRLNERHFGALTGLQKNEAAQKYSEELLAMWRRSFTSDAPLPPMKLDHPYHENTIKNQGSDNGLSSPEEYLTSETLKSATERTLQFWHSSIAPQIKSGKRIIIVSHENPLKGIIRHLDEISEEYDNVGNVLNGVPFVYTLDMNLRPVRSVEFLGDPGTVTKALEALYGQQRP